MKFELTKSNQQFSDQELIADMNRVAEKLGTKQLKQREYDNLGNFSYQTMKKRFGSWPNALKIAGLEESKKPWGGDLSETSIPEEKLVADLKRVAKELDKKTITMADYDKTGNFGSATVCKRFGGWNKAKSIAGLEIGRLYNTTDEEYFLNILNLWQKLGRQPKYREIEAPLSKLHISSYERKFGSWRAALEKFVEYINSQDEVVFTDVKVDKHIPRSNSSNKKRIKEKIQKPKKRTNRIADLRQRFRVMKRDGFKCVLCGSSPATNTGCELHIDHIIPWSKGGETIEENLRTLCSNCNLGRSNKE